MLSNRRKPKNYRCTYWAAGERREHLFTSRERERGELKRTAAQSIKIHAWFVAPQIIRVERV